MGNNNQINDLQAFIYFFYCYYSSGRFYVGYSEVVMFQQGVRSLRSAIIKNNNNT